MAAKDAFYFAALGDIAATAATGAHLLADAVRERRTDDLPDLIDAHERARTQAASIRASLVETWLPPLDRDDLRELATVLVRFTKALCAVGACLDERAYVPAVEKLAGLLARGGDLVKSSTELVADLRRNRDALARAASDELALVHAARDVFASALHASAADRTASPTALLDVVATREVLERLRRALEAIQAHANLLEALLLEYA